MPNGYQGPARRGRKRREHVLRAALVVIAERGVHATTHRAVADAADVPLATTTYYFASIDELLEQALLLFVEDELARIEAAGEALQRLAGSADEIIQAVATELSRDRVASIAQFELYVESSRRPALRAVVERSLEAYRALAEGLLVAAGCRDVDVAAPLMVALLDGLGVQDVAVGDPRREERIAEGLRRIAVAFLMDDAERARWEARAGRAGAPAASHLVTERLSASRIALLVAAAGALRSSLLDALVRDEPVPEDDDLIYERMAEEPFEPHTYVFAFRVAVPWLVHVLPFSHDVSFSVLGVAVRGAAAACCSCCSSASGSRGASRSRSRSSSPSRRRCSSRACGRGATPTRSRRSSWSRAPVHRRAQARPARAHDARRRVQPRGALFLAPLAYAVWAERLSTRACCARVAARRRRRSSRS